MMPKLTPEEKKLELKRLRDILHATIDYQITKYRSIEIKFDGYDPIASCEHLRQLTEEHFKKGRLTRLKQWLRDLTEEPRETGDLYFDRYIKERTGYDVDIFATFEKRIDNILNRKIIKTENEHRDVLSMVDNLCQQTPVDQAKVDVLNALLIDFDNRIANKRKAS
jgi:hypothetical protein